MNATIVRLGVRSVLGRRRGIMLFVLPVVLILLALTVRALSGEGIDAANAVLPDLGLHVLLPLVALIATASVLSPELDDGSIVYLLAKPISRFTVVGSKLAVALACTIVFAVVPIFLAGLVVATNEPGLALAYGVGALVGAVAYCALFTWLATLTRHAVVVGLIYVLLWEGLIGGLVGGVRWVSVTSWSGAVAESLDDRIHLLSTSLPTTYAVSATVVVLVVATALAGRALQRFNLTGDE